MSDRHATDSATALDASLASKQETSSGASTGRPGYFRRYRLPLLLALIAVCLYAGSILYILFGRGQIA